jgi:hypothetical protein
LKELLSIVKYEDDEFNGISPDLRVRCFEYIVNLFKKISETINEPQSNSKLRKDKNIDDPGFYTSLFDVVYDEKSVLEECERMMNLNYSDFNWEFYYQKETKEFIDFLKMINKHQNFEPKKSKFIKKEIKLNKKDYEEDVMNHFKNYEHEMLNHFYKIDECYYYKSELHNISREFMYLNNVKLSKWNNNSVFKYFIKFNNSSLPLINLLFFKAKMACFFEDDKKEEKLDLLEQVIDIKEWRKISASL